MKVAVSASGDALDSEVDPRFGRCPLLLVVDTESMAFEVLENPATTAPGGAGIQAAQTVAEKGVEAVITGNCGPNAFEALSAAGIDVAVGASGTVRQVVEAYQRGRLQTTSVPSAPPGHGAGGGWRPGGGGRGGTGGGGGRARRGAGRGGGGGGGGRGGIGRGEGRSGSPGGGAGRGLR